MALGQFFALFFGAFILSHKPNLPFTSSIEKQTTHPIALHKKSNMKKTKILVLLIALCLISLNNSADAQLFGRLRDKLNNAATNQAGKSSLDPTVSQGTYAKQWKDGTYSFWKRTSGGGFIDEYKAKLKFNRGADSSVISFDFITDEYTAKFEADAKGKSDFIRFFTNKNDSYRAVFFKDVVVLLNVYNNEYGGKKGSYSFIENAKKYIEDSKSQQEADLLAYETNKKAAADAEAKRLSIFAKTKCTFSQNQMYTFNVN